MSGFFDSYINGDDNIKDNDYIKNGYTNCFDDYIKMVVSVI